jgi:hypothetical protein
MQLNPIDRTCRDKKRIKAALDVYRGTNLPLARNCETQTILYRIDHAKSLVDEFCCFTLERDEDILGYLQYSYFGLENIFFVENFCICEKTLNDDSVFGDAIHAIQGYLAQRYRPGFTITCEIAQRCEADRWFSDTEIIGHFARLGFRTVDFPYRYPIVPSGRGATSCPADLMVAMPDQRDTVSASELRTILRCIYFKYYLYWDRPFLLPQQFIVQERLVSELYSDQVARIRDHEAFTMDGDAKRGTPRRFAGQRSPSWDLVYRFFAPKMLRLLPIIGVLLFTIWFLTRVGSGISFLPFILTTTLIYSLTENTRQNRKLLLELISRLKL